MLKRSEALPKVKEWIEANFEDKKGGCVAKRDIFDAYVAFCRAHNYQTTNDATFGKIFKTIFPHVQVRRLVRRVKAKKWHYCDVAYRQDSPLAIAAGPALSATAVATTDDDCCSDDSGTAPRTKAARCSGSGRGPPKKRKRSTSAAQKKGHLSDDEEVEQDANEKNHKKRLRGEEEEEQDDDNDDEDGDYVETEQPSLMVQAPEEDEVDGGTPSAGATSIWSDSEDESSSSSSSSCYASPSLPDTTSKPAAAAEIKHEEDKDLLQSSTDTPVSHTPSERAPVPTCLATSTTGLSLCGGGGGDIDLSASSVIRVSSMLHSSSAFPLLVGTSAGLPPFGPATKRLDDSSELGSEAPPSLTSSSAEMFFSYQPASSTALADFVKAEPREEAEAEPEEKPARRHPPTPTMAASTVDREQTAPHAVAAAPPAIAPAYAHAHTFPAHYSTHEGAAAPAEPSPFEASRNLPIHSQTMTSLLLAHGHTTTSTFSMPTPSSYAYTPAPHLIHASSTASANQASAFLPGQQHYQHGHQHQHQHQHHSHQHQPHQQFAYPPYPIAQHQPPPFVTTSSATTHPSWPQQTTNHQTTNHQTDREMSPESVEIFISHLLTDKSGEVMTLRPQQ